MTRKTALLAAALLVLVLLATRRPDRAPVTPAAAPAPTGAAAVSAAAPPAPHRVHPALDPAMLSAAALRQSLDDYKSASQYPPGSHRWSPETAGENQPWNQTFPVELPLDDRPGRETVSRFAADRHHVVHGAALTSTIEVWPAAHPEQRLPVTIRSAMVEAFARGRTGVALTYRDDGRDGDAVDGDRVYTSRFVPSAHDALAAAAAQVRLQVDISAGGVDRLLHLDFTYTPQPLLALVAGRTGVAAGALALDLDLDVRRAGRYQFYADVIAADGVTPIGWITTPWIELAAGRRSVALSLFGKVVRDRGIAGPYRFTELRAVAQATDTEIEAWWSDPRSFTTDAHALAEFDPSPWDGADRRANIAALEAAIAEQEDAERLAAGD